MISHLFHYISKLRFALPLILTAVMNINVMFVIFNLYIYLIFKLNIILNYIYYFYLLV